jgi:hypothetical protein
MSLCICERPIIGVLRRESGSTTTNQVSNAFYQKYLTTQKEGCVQERMVYFTSDLSFSYILSNAKTNGIYIEGTSLNRYSGSSEYTDPNTWVLPGNGDNSQNEAYIDFISPTEVTGETALVINAPQNTISEIVNLVETYGITIVSVFGTENGGIVIAGYGIHNSGLEAAIRSLIGC